MRRAGEIVTALLVVLLAGGIWLHFHDARVTKRAVVAEQLKETKAAKMRDDSLKRTREDSLQSTRKHSDAVRAVAHAKVAAYDSLRAAVDISAPQPAGVPDGYVIVPIAYVHAADSVAAIVPRLEAALEQERAAASSLIAAADSSIAIRDVEIAQLRIAGELKRPGFTGTLKHAAVGGIVVLALVEIFGKH